MALNFYIWNNILSMLDEKDLCSVRAVSRQLKEASDGLFKTNCYFKLGGQNGRRGVTRTPKMLLEFLVQNPTAHIRNLSIIRANLDCKDFEQVAKILGPTVSKLTLSPGLCDPSEIKSLLQTHFPNLQTLTIGLVYSNHVYTDPIIARTLNITNLSIEQEGIHYTGERGIGIKSLLISCRQLRRLDLKRCNFPERGLMELASGSGCQDLRILNIEAKVNSSVIPVFASAATEERFNQLIRLEIKQLIDTNRIHIINLFEFITKQPNLHTVRISRIDTVKFESIMELSFLMQNQATFEKLSILTKLTTLCISPMFALSVLQKCVNLHTLVLSQINDYELQGFEDREDRMHLVFGNMVNSLWMVKRLQLCFSFYFANNRTEFMDTVLAWFPAVLELHIDGYHPDCLPSIWKRCKRITKMKLKLVVDRWDFHLDSGFTGYIPFVCNKRRNYYVNSVDAEDYMFRNIPPCSVLELTDLCSLELQFQALYGKAVWIFEDKDHLKMTDLTFTHVILSHPRLKHFKLDESVNGNYACIKISAGTSLLLQKLLCRQEYEMTDWGLC